MKILFDATVLEIPFTGIAKSTLCLYESCYTINPSLQFDGFIKKEPYTELPSVINLHQLQKRLFSALYSRKTIEQIVKKTKPDVIHFPWHGNIPHKFDNVKTVMTLHDVLPLEIPNYFPNSKQEHLYKNKIQADIEKCDVIFTDSFYSKKQIETNFDIKCEILVNNLAPTLSPPKNTTYKKPVFHLRWRVCTKKRLG
jgi:hypothetical protein